jgi:hypothetical protein
MQAASTLLGMGPSHAMATAERLYTSGTPTLYLLVQLLYTCAGMEAEETGVQKGTAYRLANGNS